MNNMYRKRVEKIYKKIKSIASAGNDNKLEFIKYAYELIDKQDFTIFEEVLSIYYKIDLNKQYKGENLNQKLYKAWDIISESTKSTFLTKLTNLYKERGVYQLTFNIYLENNGRCLENSSYDDCYLLGEIREEEVRTDNFEYYLKNGNYARLIGERRTYLKVKKRKENGYILIDSVNDEISEENNLINRYKEALDYLYSRQILTFNGKVLKIDSKILTI